MATIPSKLAGMLARLCERGEVRRAGGEWRTRCPAHDDNGPSLYLRLSLDGTVVLLNCKSGCDAEEIVAALDKDMSDLFVEDDTLVEIDEDFRIANSAPLIDPVTSGHALEEASDESAGTPVVPAGADLLHEIYSSLLALLTLSEAHRLDLHRRGLDETAIEQYGYRTLSRFALNQAVGQLKTRFDDATLLRIPGFRQRRGRVRFMDVEGLLVLVRDLEGRIVALKVRPDRSGGAKYLWVSSSNDGGPSPGSPPHVPLDTPPKAELVRLTEGELKADISSKLSGMPTVGMSGVTNWRPCLPILEALGVKVVHLAFDADARDKPGIARELATCTDALIHAGLEVRLETWSLEDAKGIDDLLAAGKPPEVVSGSQVLPTIAGMIGSSGPTPAGEDEDEWVPIEASETVAPFPTDCLPTPVARFVNEAAEAIQCPVDFLGAAALTVAAAAIGGSRRLRIRRGYEEGPQIYAAIVAPPGSAKSPALRAVCAPVYAQQKRRREQYRRAKEQYEKDVEAYEVARRRPTRKDDEDLPRDAPVKPVPPEMGHIFVGDVTIECLGLILERNSRGVLMIRDELTSWVRSHNQYRSGKGADKQFYLSSWSGEPAKVDRKSDRGEPLFVLNPSLSVLGCIPPGKLGDLDAGNDGDDGFIHRILFSYPDSVLHRRWSWHGLSKEVRDAWDDTVTKLYDLAMGVDEHGQPTAVVRDLAPEAMPLWTEWYDRHAQEMESSDFPEILIGPWSKLIAYAVRFALIIHLLRQSCGESLGDDVDAASLRRAFRLITYFQSHARAVYSKLGQSDKAKQVQQVIRWIRAHGGTCNPTHLARHNVGGIEKTSEAEALMKELEDRGYGHREQRQSANHRKVTWFVTKTRESGPIGSNRVP